MTIRTILADGVFKAEYRGEFWDAWELSTEIRHMHADIHNNALDGMELKGALIVIWELEASLAALREARTAAARRSVFK